MKVLLVAASESLIAKIKALREGISYQLAGNAEEACSIVCKEDVQLVLIHLSDSQGEDGVADVLQATSGLERSCPTLVLVDNYQPEQAISLLKLGVADYFATPVDLAKLAFLLDVVSLRCQPPVKPAPVAAARPLRAGPAEVHHYVVAPEIAELMEQVRRVAPQDITILVTGETGTGKTHLARLIHQLSPRRDKPFLVVDCSALSASLIESEMFGHVKGAFTGADSERAGKLAVVGEGTLVLDEINSLPPALQGKLLRAVEERVFEPVGSNRSVPLRARLITVSNVPLEEEVSAGRFRADLYYRLNVVGFFVPPLRDRRGAIAPLCNKFLAEFMCRNRPDLTGIAPEASKALQEYHWPGNVRELRNVLERATALAAGPVVQLSDIPELIRSASNQADRLPAPLDSTEEVAPNGTLGQARDAIEMRRIREALGKHRNNRMRAAAELGISRMGLYKKLHKYGLIESDLID
jgi:DNA-binding NtrC family response regulator